VCDGKRIQRGGRGGWRDVAGASRDGAGLTEGGRDVGRSWYAIPQSCVIAMLLLSVQSLQQSPVVVQLLLLLLQIYQQFLKESSISILWERERGLVIYAFLGTAVFLHSIKGMLYYSLTYDL